MTFTNALVVSFSHGHTTQAIRQVVELVRRVDGHVRVLGVIPQTSALQRLFTPHTTTDHIDEILRADLEHDLHDRVHRATGEHEPDDVEVTVDTGHPVATVLQHAIDGDHDLLAVTSDPDDRAAEAIVKRLQRKSPCPVWAIRPSRARKRRIVAAIDTDPDHHGLDRRILAAAAWLAGSDDEVHVVTAWELVGESTLRDSPFLSVTSDELDELRARCEHEHCSILQQLVAEQAFSTRDVHLHVRSGPPTGVICDLVERHHANQLVMGTIGRTGLPGFLIGNTAEQLLGAVPCSLLVVKPPGFTSPFHT